MNNDLEKKYYKLIDDNVNVGKRSDGKEFLILLSGLAAICIAIYVFADFFAGIVIDNMPDKAQVKLENVLSFSSMNLSKTNKHPNAIKTLEEIKPKIVALDKKLQNKSTFNICEIDKDEINAFVLPNGDIYFTSGLIDRVDDKEVLTFILAHEMGHYAHRDHLKAIGRELTISTLMSFITFGHKDIASAVNGMTGINQIHHSHRQEVNADLYANGVLYKLYGNNSAAVKFFELLKKEENLPEFVYYISTHPSNETRLRLIQRRK